MSVKINEQVKRVLNNLDKLVRDVRNSVHSALYMEAVDIMRTSLKEVPVDTGLLRSTAYVTAPTYTGQIKVELGYQTNYAEYVHENRKAKHLAPTKSHFLTDPIQAALPGLAARVAALAKMLRESGNTVVKTQLFKAPKRGGKRIKVGVSFRKRKSSSRIKAPVGAKR